MSALQSLFQTGIICPMLNSTWALVLSTFYAVNHIFLFSPLWGCKLRAISGSDFVFPKHLAKYRRTKSMCAKTLRKKAHSWVGSEMPQMRGRDQPNQSDSLREFWTHHESISHSGTPKWSIQNQALWVRDPGRAAHQEQVLHVPQFHCVLSPQFHPRFIFSPASQFPSRTWLSPPWASASRLASCFSLPAKGQ